MEVEESFSDLLTIDEDKAALLTNRSHVANLIDPDAEDAMLRHLAGCSEAYFQHADRDLADLSIEEKMAIAQELLRQSAGLFLERYARHLSVQHLRNCFKPLSDGDAMVNFYLSKYDAAPSESAAQIDLYGCRRRRDGGASDHVRRKNRRYSAMRNLMAENSFFSDSEMKRRQPLLWEQLVGQFLSPSEAVQISHQGQRLLEREEAASRAKHVAPPHHSATTQLSSGECNSMAQFLERHLVQTQENELYAAQHAAEAEATEEVDESDDEEEVQESLAHMKSGRHIALNEKQLLREEFLTLMQRRFIQGLDHEFFDYASVDCDSDLDLSEERLLDSESNYFDTEEANYADEPDNMDLI